MKVPSTNSVATKLFSENEAEFEGNKTEERVIALFDKVKWRLQEKERRKAEKKEEAFITEELEKVPRWAEDLQEDIAGLQKVLRVERKRTVERSDSFPSEDEEAFYNSRERKSKKKRHEAKDPPVQEDKEDPSSNR